MKFAALTLVLLLAVGSQAASLHSDAPEDGPPRELQQMRSILDYTINELIGSVKNVVATLDDEEYANVKVSTSKNLEDMYKAFIKWQSEVSMVTDGIYSNIRDFVQKAITEDPLPQDHLDELRRVIKNNTEYYYEQVKGILIDFIPTHKAEMEKLKARLGPVVGHIGGHLEATKNAADPVLTALNNKVNKQLEEIRSMVLPYVEEFKTSMNQAYDQSQTLTNDQYTALQKKIEKDFEDIGEKLNAIYENIFSTFNQS
ncbi:apolipoprotein A-Ib [Brachionichthys hirsutus]|uniref:apolipoprotein A-Ib n=1 Tax=Brachionichthys hirsutus TaxID=412623 RepID=UPI0036051289